MNGYRFAMSLSLVLAVGGGIAPDGAAEESESRTAVEANNRLGRGINLGNALEAPEEGAWGMVLEERYFEEIEKAGFDSVRIPIRWSAHAKSEPPYTIEADFFERVDWAIEQALSHGLNAVINIHHYDKLYASPSAHRERFLALWRQIGARYKDRPGSLYFEVLNEPHDPLDAETWNALIPEVLAVIRETNADRFVIVGPTHWNSIGALEDLKLPEDDRRLIVTVHNYEPFHFTHQGASWVEGADAWRGTKWTGSPEQRKAVTDHLDVAADWSRRHDRPIFLGEFGAYSAADMESRVRWTRFVREQAERRGFSWAYWEFGAGFGAFDRSTGQWRSDVLSALISQRSNRSR